MGCHPTRCKDFEKENNPKSYLASLIKLAQDNRENIVAIGECGLGKCYISKMTNSSIVLVPSRKLYKYKHIGHQRIQNVSFYLEFLVQINLSMRCFHKNSSGFCWI